MIQFIAISIFILFLSILSYGSGLIGVFASTFLPLVAGVGVALMMAQFLLLPNRGRHNIGLEGGDQANPPNPPQGVAADLNNPAAVMGVMQGMLGYMGRFFGLFYFLMERLIHFALPMIGRAPRPPIQRAAREEVWPRGEGGVRLEEIRPGRAPEPLQGVPINEAREPPVVIIARGPEVRRPAPAEADEEPPPRARGPNRRRSKAGGFHIHIHLSPDLIGREPFYPRRRPPRNA